MYAIIEHVNPYHAKFYYRNEQVVSRDGATPTRWVLNDMKYSTEQEAKDALWQLALLYESKEDCLAHNNKSDFEYMAKLILEDNGKSFTVEELGYDGEGVYYNDNNRLMMKKGASSFEFDVESFSVEKIEEVDGHIEIVI